MSGRLAGKTALVTGAARGIGRACALRFAEEGARVALFDIARDVPGVPYAGASRAQLDATAEAVRAAGGEVLVFVGDVTASADLTEAVGAVVRAWGGLDIAVAAAGVDSWAGRGNSPTSSGNACWTSILRGCGRPRKR